MGRKSKEENKSNDQEVELFKQTLGDRFKNAKFFGGKDLPPAVPNFTGSLRMDIMLQAPFFEGAIVELFGETGSGKTTLALSVLNEAAINKPNKKLLYLDQEMRLRDTLLSTFPSLRDKLEIIQAETGNEALQIAELWLRQFPGSLVVIDSVDSLIPDSGKEIKDIGETQVGGLSRLMGDACRRMTKSAAQSGSTVIFLNQLRNKIGGYGNPETTSGGKALPFYASQRIQLKGINAESRILDSNGTQIGHRVRFKVVKNSVTVPFVEGEFPLIYGKGVDKVEELVELACDLDVLNKEGNYILIKDDTGEDKKRPPKTVKDMMRADNKFFEDTLNKVQLLYPDVFHLEQKDE